MIILSFRQCLDNNYIVVNCNSYILNKNFHAGYKQQISLPSRMNKERTITKTQDNYLIKIYNEI